MTDQVKTEIPLVLQEWVVAEPVPIEEPEPVREEVPAGDFSKWDGTIKPLPSGVIAITISTKEMTKAIEKMQESVAERVVDFERVAILGRQAMAWNSGPSCRCALCAEVSELGEDIERSRRAFALCTPSRRPITGRVPDNFGLTINLE